MTIPAIAIPHTSARSPQPVWSPRTIKQIGVYVPAISIKIIIWSIFFRILFTFGEISSV